MLAVSALLMAFALPGYLFSRHIHRWDGLPGYFHVILGFFWSFSVFTIVVLPFFHFEGPFTGFSTVCFLIWILALVFGLWKLGTERVFQENTNYSDPFLPSIPNIWPLFLAIPLLLLLHWFFRGSLPITFGLVILSLFVAPAFTSRRSIPVPQTGHASKIWGVLATMVVLGFAASTYLSEAFDHDDSFYVSRTQQLSQSDTLTAEEPTLKEGFLLARHGRYSVWELWGACLSRLTGENPQSLLHTFLPPWVLLLAALATLMMFTPFVPPGLIPITLVLFFSLQALGSLLGSSDIEFFFKRPWIGKVVNQFVCMPAIVCIVDRLFRRYSRALIASLGCLMIASIGLTLSSLFLTPIFSCTLFVTYAILFQNRLLLVKVSTTLIPLFILGLMIKLSIPQDELQVLVPNNTPTFTWSDWILYRGPIELAWFLSIPIQLMLFRGPSMKSYFLFFPLALLAFTLSPLGAGLLTKTFIPQMTYFRIYWSLPFVAALSILATVLTQSLAATWKGKKYEWAVTLGTILFLLGCLITPNILRVARGHHWRGPGGRLNLNARPEKIPLPLSMISEVILSDENHPKSKILCNEILATYLASLSGSFYFVQSRPLYSLYYYSLHGRPAEAIERFILTSFLLDPGLSKAALFTNWERIARFYGPDVSRLFFGNLLDAPFPFETLQLLKKYRVGYVVLDPADQKSEFWKRNSFTRILSHDGYELWKSTTI